MPKVMPLKPATITEMRRMARDLPKMKQFKVSFSKRKLPSKAKAGAALRNWQKTIKKPKPPQNPMMKIKSTLVNKNSVSKLGAIIQSETAPHEMVVNQKFRPEDFLNNLYSTLTAYQFMLMEAEYKKRRASPRNVPQMVEKEWAEVQKAARMAYAAGGLTVSSSQLFSFSKALSQDPKNRDAIIKIEKTSQSIGKSPKLSKSFQPKGTFLTAVDWKPDPPAADTVILDICDKPISEGSFTKHFTRSLSLSVSIPYWCPTWTNPLRTCRKRITLAGVSFSMGLNVGYKVTCCGATAWGQAHVQACATIVGISVCAGCTGTIVGVAGVSTVADSAGLCTYGLGLAAELRCKIGSVTIFYASVPFGWTIKGPCPPAGVCP